ncbi:hypothetical protein Bbelb_291110 [Branchiostoma belcheri]|nr:hypothetical protein Bbelb_291110 [Branchiostoma belcheri]
METKDKGKLSPTSNYNGQRNNSTTGLRGQFCESSAKFCGTSPNLTQVLPQSPARRPAIFRRTYRGISQNVPRKLMRGATTRDRVGPLFPPPQPVQTGPVFPPTRLRKVSKTITYMVQASTVSPETRAVGEGFIVRLQRASTYSPKHDALPAQRRASHCLPARTVPPDSEVLRLGSTGFAGVVGLQRAQDVAENRTQTE